MHPRLDSLVRLRGITLVETLVVIGVLAVLSVVGFTSFKSVYRLSDRSLCMANLKEIGRAALTYAGDHYGTLPGPLGTSLQYAYYNSRAETDPRSLVDFLRPYLGLPRVTRGENVASVMVCPAALKVVHGQGGSSQRGRFYTQTTQVLFDNPNQKQYPFGYRYTDGRQTELPARLAAVAQPSRVQLLRDGIANSATSKSSPDIPWEQPHGTFYNALFMDGHVKMVPLP